MSNMPERTEGLSPLKRALLALETMQTKLDRLERTKSEPIAIVGMGCRFPGGANDPETFWQLLRDGVDTMRDVPGDRWDLETYYDPNPDAPGKMYTRQGAFIDGVDQFDAAFFGISPREAALMDPQQRLFLEVCWEALERAGVVPETLIGSRTGVFVGVMYTDYSRLDLGGATHIDAYSSTGNSISVVAGRVSYLLGLQGPSITLDTACSSSLVAIHLACQSLRSRESNLVLAGGVSVMLIPDNNITLCRTRALSPEGRCKTFDASANGFARGEGCGVVALQRLSDAIADGSPILAVIRGTAVNQDGRSNGLTAPNGPAQQAVLRDALSNAGIKPHQVSYIEAHGTGTPLGDPIEVGSLAAVLGEGRTPEQSLSLGSVKTNIGHLEAAAGVAGLMKVVLSMQHGQIPPHLHLQQLNPYINWGNLPIAIPTELTSWQVGTETRIAGVSSFGFGGTNAHILVESASPTTGLSTPDEGDRAYLFPLSAQTPAALLDLAQTYREFLRGKTSLSVSALPELVDTASLRRSHHKQRLALVGQSLEQLADLLDGFLLGEPRFGLASGPSESIGTAPVFVYSGQGSQWIGMGQQLLQEPVFCSTLEECDRLLQPRTTWSLLQELAAPESQSRLHDTEVAQVAIVCLQIALTALWQSWGIAPGAVVGHSVGEITAAYVAGVLSLEDTLKLVVHRAKLMQQATGQGQMAAIGLPYPQVEALLSGMEGVAIAAINSPVSTVVSGNADAVAAIVQKAEQQGVFARLLRVNYAFHCPQMQPHSTALMAAMQGLAPQPARLPLFSTVTGDRTDGRDWHAAYWGRNVREAVRFGPAIARVLEEGYTCLIEVSPHPILSRNLQECLTAQMQSGLVLASLHREQGERAFLLGELGRLYTLGYAIKWEALYPKRSACVPLPTYPWQHERYWIDPPRPAEQTVRTAHQPRHPLLGHCLQDLAPLPGVWLWQTQLQVQSLPYLTDHRVQGSMVLPGAAYVEMAIAATQLAFHVASPTLETLNFKQGLFIPETAAQSVQVVLRSGEQPDTVNFECYGRAANADTQPWKIHAEGLLSLKPTERKMLEAEAIATIQARCQEQVSGSQHYQAMAEQGLGYGASFQGVQQIWRREGEALARLRLPTAIQTDAQANVQYQIHPALLDACFQAIAQATPLANPDAEAEGTYLPVQLNHFKIHRSPQSSEFWVHLRLHPQTEPNAFAAELLLLDDQGQRILEADSLRIQRLESALEDNWRDWLYDIAWERLPDRFVIKPTAPGYWLILADQQGVGQALGAQFQQRGAACVLVAVGTTFQQTEPGHYQLQPDRRQDFQQLLQAVSCQHQPCLGVIHLWSLDTAVDMTTIAALQTDHTLTTISVLHLVQALAQMNGQPPRLWLVTRGAQAVQSGDRVNVAQSSLWGLGRVIAQELPNLRCSRVDLPAIAHSNDSESLLQLIGADPAEDQMALRSDAFYVARLDRHVLAASQPVRFHADATYLITGGLRGLGLQVASWMVDQGARHLALLSRSAPSIAAQEVLQRLEEAGVQIKILQADVADTSAVSSGLAELELEMPPLRGVIHSAAVLDDGVLLQLTPERFQQVMRPKCEGAWNLHTLTLNQPLDFFVLFSSIASLLGSAGQGNYAAANAWLDGLAHYRHQQGLPALSLNWGAWAEIGLAAAQANRGDRISAQGFRSIPPQRGLEVLGRLLSDAAAQVGVMPVNWSSVVRTNPTAATVPFLQRLVGTIAPPTADQDSGLTRQILLSAAPDTRLPLLQTYFHAQVARVLRLPIAKLDPHLPLNSQGLDSLVAVELKNRLESDLGVSVSMVQFIQGPSVAELSAQVWAQIVEESAFGAHGAVPSERVSDPLGKPVEVAANHDEWEDGEL